MPNQAEQLDVMTVIETRKMVHAAHPTQRMPPHVEAALQAEDVIVCIGKAQLREDGTLLIQLKALPLDGRLVIRLPK